MTNIKDIFMICFCLSMAIQISAQGNFRFSTPEERAKQLDSILNEKLSLSDEQFTLVKAINLKFAKESGQLRSTMSEFTSRDSIRIQMRQIDENKTNALKEILTTEQFQLYLKWQEEQMAARRARFKEDKY